MLVCTKQHCNAQAFSATRPRSSTRQLSVRVFNKRQFDGAINDDKTLGDIAGRAGAAAMSGLLTLSVLTSGAAYARPTGVNRPELLPTEQTPVIDVAGFLTPSEEKRIASQVEALELDTGFRLRLLAQNYPETPGLAIRDFWGVDDTSIVFVADPTFGDILNFNVGQAVDLEVPQSFWSRLAGKYGNKFYWQEKGEAASILSAVNAIDACLREPSGRAKCATVQGGMDQ
eukprot:GHRQ01002623.1.p1 GENE.GHRQ01002623.1~~GHRQ01002623.1.p1  ORF type:complete len:229 (+),score=68.22 GHRQ01002623.1:201-887(+)